MSSSLSRSETTKSSQSKYSKLRQVRVTTVQNEPTMRSLMSREKVLAQYKIIIDGVDYTPLPFDKSLFEYNTGRHYDLQAQTPSHTDSKALRSQSAIMFKNQLHTQNVQGDNYRQSVIFAKSHESDDVLRVTSFIERPEEDEPVSVFSTITESSGSGADINMQKVPTQISLILGETETFFLLDLPSSTELKDTPEGEAAEQDNKLYDYLTVGKGRNRRVFESAAQTDEILLKSRSTQADQSKRRHGSTFASNWEMYDTLHADDADQLQQEEEDDWEALEEDEDEDADVGHEHKLKEIKSVESVSTTVEEDKELIKIVKSTKFQDALLVVERLLANNCFNYQQKRFRALADPDEFREQIEYHYRLELLWTFKNEKTEGRCVTAMNWNKVNSDVVAVGYGKFYFAENTTGMVMVWNIKNPKQPERQYNFDDPVTSVAFSSMLPHLLAIGFYYGRIIVIDVSYRDLKIAAESQREDSLSFEAVWHISWIRDEEQQNKEQVVASFEDGRVCMYLTGKGSHLKCSQIMQVARAEGKLKGANVMKMCETSAISISRYAAALFITPHPNDPSIYYVGTNEGVVHKCSTNYYNQHLDLFRAHNGPVYNMKFSPFCNRLFVTCGDDWCVRVWVEGITDPIAETMTSMESVQGVDWSPIHSTILAMIRGKDIHIYDIQRKIYGPQSSHPSPSNSRNTIVQFTKNGRSLAVGDIDGNVHVFSLEDMPFPPFFQDDLLIQSLRRILVAKPDVLHKLKKLGKLSFTKKDKER